MIEKNRLRPPEFEIRANQFMHHVNGVAMKMKREGQSLFNLTVEKALSTWADRYDAFQKFLIITLECMRKVKD